MHSSLLVVDDFLDNAEGLRAAALRLTYPEQEGAFPGRNSLERINIEGLADEVSHLLGEPLRPIDPLESHGKVAVFLDLYGNKWDLVEFA